MRLCHRASALAISAAAECSCLPATNPHHRHDSQEGTSKQALVHDLASVSTENQRMRALLTSSASKRRKNMVQRYDNEAAALQSDHEKQEHETFLEIPGLKDKPNREEREKHMQADFRTQMDTEREEMVIRHSVKSGRLETQVQLEKIRLERALE